MDRPSDNPAAPATGPAGWLQDAERIDVALYAAIAQTPTPTLDRAMARLSHAADYSRLSLASAAVLAATGGRRGRRAAANGLASVAVAASVINLAVKPLGHRRRPDRAAQEVPLARQVRMPSSTSFPSGHSAAAFAFATGVGHVLPPAAIPLRGLAALVAYSRVHTGVHYPGDVVAGALMGTTLAQITTHALEPLHGAPQVARLGTIGSIGPSRPFAHGSRGGRRSAWKSTGSRSPICSTTCSRSASSSSWRGLSRVRSEYASAARTMTATTIRTIPTVPRARGTATVSKGLRSDQIAGRRPHRWCWNGSPSGVLLVYGRTANVLLGSRADISRYG